MNHKTPAVITPMNVRLGLDIARALGKRGVPVYGVDPDPKEAGGKSKYCQLVVSPDLKTSPEAFIAFLVDFGKQLEHKSVLYAINDGTVLLCSRERARLQPYYEFVMPDHTTLANLLTKQGLDGMAQASDIPTPQTVIPHNAAELTSMASQLTYPVIIKPIQSEYWYIPEIVSMLRENPISGQAKVWPCQGEGELLDAYQKIARFDDRLIVQETIPGPDGNLTYISFYLDRDSKPLAMFAGCKLRVLPIGFGSASYARSFYDPELEALTLKFLTAVQYRGLGGVEFKKDPRDGRYKLIEFNTRFGLWDGLGRQCGVDTAYIAYRDTLHLPVEPHLKYREGVNWVELQRDIRAFWMYRQRGELTFGQWLRSLRGETMWATYSWEDWRPGVASTLSLLWAFAKRMFSNLRN